MERSCCVMPAPRRDIFASRLWSLQTRFNGDGEVSLATESDLLINVELALFDTRSFCLPKKVTVSWACPYSSRRRRKLGPVQQLRFQNRRPPKTLGLVLKTPVLPNLDAIWQAWFRNRSC